MVEKVNKKASILTLSVILSASNNIFCTCCGQSYKVKAEDGFISAFKNSGMKISEKGEVTGKVDSTNMKDNLEQWVKELETKNYMMINLCEYGSYKKGEGWTNKGEDKVAFKESDYGLMSVLLIDLFISLVDGCENLNVKKTFEELVLVIVNVYRYCFYREEGKIGEISNRCKALRILIKKNLYIGLGENFLNGDYTGIKVVEESIFTSSSSSENELPYLVGCEHNGEGIYGLKRAKDIREVLKKNP